MAVCRDICYGEVLRNTIAPKLVAASILAIGLSAMAVAQAKPEPRPDSRPDSRKEYRFTVGARPNISVDTQNGAISVKPGSNNVVIVTASIKSDNVEVDQQQTGNRIEIASHVLEGKGQTAGQIDYELLVPAGATISLRSSTGPLSAERLQGDVSLEGSDAVVNVRNVELGHLHVQTMKGPITLTDVRNAHVELSTISGDIHLKSVSGPLVQANSGSGKIFYDGDFSASGDYKFTTHTGDIEASAPSDVSADFRAHSVLGKVQNDFPLRPQHSRFPSEEGRSFIGTTGKAGSEVVLRSFSGKIRLKQR